MNKKSRTPNLSPNVDNDFRQPTPEQSALQLDALLYLIHTRYSDSTEGKTPDLGTFLITRAEVVFTEDVAAVQLEKKPEKRLLQILTPILPPEAQEARTIFLLKEFGELILKYQKEAYLQIREMLLRITAPDGHKDLIEAFERYKSTLKASDEEFGQKTSL